SPVRMVRAYATRSGARVAVSLRNNVPWTVSSGADGLVHIDFTVPEEMQETRNLASQSFTESAPSEPSTSGGEDGLSGAYTSETLIGEAGRTMDPQSVFGSGRGADSPASMLGGVSGFSFDSTTASSSQWSGRRINIDLVEADIHSVFRLISHVSKLNIVSGDDVSGSVTVRLVDVPWDQAFSAVLQAKGLAAQRFGNIVRVAPIETIKAETQAALEASRAREELTPLQILIIPLNYANAADVKEQIESQLSSRGSVEVDSRANQLIIKDTEEILAQIREIIRKLDQATPQVLIEARVVEANSKYSRSLGIQWGGEINASAATGYTTGLFFPSSIGIAGGNEQSDQAGALFYSPGQDNLAVSLPASGSLGSLAFSLGSVPGVVNLDARLTAMETDGWGEIVSSPRITTLDNTSASIKQGAQIPYLSTSSGGTQVKFVQAALELTVTPHITSDDKIFMNINIENNRPDFSNLVQGQPGIQIKEAQTELLVANGDTTVIGGVFSTEQAKSMSRVPFFGQIPLIGRLFSTTSRNTSRNEMLVFVTPRVITESVSSN
ncbi:MAG: type IV pilus secretin PilQ, partial [Myxococcota bacterium]|nr:type IV pilus secretin PilQ [Myxococcota bacterium]